jgi:hypothetical protein
VIAEAVAGVSPSRAECLGGVLRNLGVGAGTPLAVLVCAEHAADRDVAAAAGALLGSRVAVVPVDLTDDALRRTLRECRGGLLLACGEGFARWQESGVPMRVIADGAGSGVLWWRLLELEERSRRLLATG